MKTLLGMFVKQPIPGTVKTRLAAGVGAETAARIYSAFVEDLTTIHSETADMRFLGFAPNTEPAAAWTAEVGGSAFGSWPQPEGDLGQRMQAFFEYAFTAGAERAILIGSDSPNLPPDYVENAFDLLGENDVVIGPASDGGYYLIGQRQSARDIFKDTDWSSPQVFEQTSARVRQAGASLGLLPVWYDIDNVEDARMLWAHTAAAAYSGAGDCGLAKTQVLLEQLFASS